MNLYAQHGLTKKKQLTRLKLPMEGFENSAHA